MPTILTHRNHNRKQETHPAEQLLSRILFSTRFAQKSCYTESNIIRNLSQICERSGNIYSSLWIVGVHREPGNVCI